MPSLSHGGLTMASDRAFTLFASVAMSWLASTAPTYAQSIIACEWQTFAAEAPDWKPTYRVSASGWEVFDREAWQWTRFCTNFMRGNSYQCQQEISDARYSYNAVFAERDPGFRNKRYELAITVDRSTGRATWSRWGATTFDQDPDLNFVLDEGGAGQCAAATDPSLAPKPAPVL